MLEEQRPSFYIAVVVYEFTSDNLQTQTLYSEDFILIKATSQDEAQQKTLLRLQKEEMAYKNEQGDTITVKLKHVVDVHAMTDEKFADGSDLYTRFFRDYAAYTAFEPFFSGGL